jgi:hypothetical protein
MSRKLFEGSCYGTASTHAAAAASYDNNNSDNTIKVIRHRMIKRLQNRLEKTCPDSSSTYKVSCAVEHLLYKTSFDITEYQNIDTLNERLRSILAIQLCKRSLRRHGKTNTTNNKNTTTKPQQPPPQQQQPQSRSSVLTDILGSTRYTEVCILVDSIRKARLQKVVSMKGCCGGGRVCPLPSGRRETYQANEPFPQPIQDLFFHIPLVEIFDKSSPSKLREHDWNSLIEEARTKYNTFQEYNNATK